MDKLTVHKIDFFVALIDDLARHFVMSSRDTYLYVRQYGGVTAFFEHYDVLHTLSFHDMVDWMIGVCSRNGGNLR